MRVEGAVGDCTCQKIKTPALKTKAKKLFLASWKSCRLFSFHLCSPAPPVMEPSASYSFEAQWVRRRVCRYLHWLIHKGGGQRGRGRGGRHYDSSVTYRHGKWMRVRWWAGSGAGPPPPPSLPVALYPLQALPQVVQVGGGQGGAGVAGRLVLLLVELPRLLQLRQLALQHICGGGHRRLGWQQGRDRRPVLWLLVATTTTTTTATLWDERCQFETQRWDNGSGIEFWFMLLRCGDSSHATIEFCMEGTLCSAIHHEATRGVGCVPVWLQGR